MSCIITYKGQKYSEEQFKEYFINNKQEFATSIAKNKDVIDSFKRKMEGIDYVFSQSPELASIGSKTQYLQYLSTIFKTSKVKDIVYHGTKEKFDKFDKLQTQKNISKKIFNEYVNGFYFSEKGEYGKEYSVLINSKIIRDFTELFKAVNTDVDYELNKELNQIANDIENKKFDTAIIERPLNLRLKPSGTYVTTIKTGETYSVYFTNDGMATTANEVAKNVKEEELEYYEKLNEDNLNYNNALKNKYNWYVVFEPSQIHILGSKQDIEGFKEFVQNDAVTSSENTTTEITENQAINNLKDKIENINSDFDANVVTLDNDNNVSIDLNPAMDTILPNRVESRVLPNLGNSDVDMDMFDEMLFRLQQAMPGVEFKLDTTIGTKGSVISKKGKLTVLINPNKFTADTLLHEYAHIYIEILIASGYSSRVNSAIEALKDSPLWKEVADAYPELSLEDLGKEVLATAMGFEGTEDFVKTGNTLEQRSKIKDFINALLNILRDILGLQPNTARQLARELLNKTTPLNISTDMLFEYHSKVLTDTANPLEEINLAILKHSTAINTRERTLRRSDGSYVKAKTSVTKLIAAGKEFDLVKFEKILEDNAKIAFGLQDIPESTYTIEQKDAIESFVSSRLAFQESVRHAGINLHALVQDIINDQVNANLESYFFTGGEALVSPGVRTKIVSELRKIIIDIGIRHPGSKIYSELPIFADDSTTPIMGILDILVVTPNGTAVIYDLKISANSTRNGTEISAKYLNGVYKKHAAQLFTYGGMIKKIFNIDVVEHVIIPGKVVLSGPTGNVIDDIEFERNLEMSSISSIATSLKKDAYDSLNITIKSIESLVEFNDILEKFLNNKINTARNFLISKENDTSSKSTSELEELIKIHNNLNFYKTIDNYKTSVLSSIEILQRQINIYNEKEVIAREFGQLVDMATLNSMVSHIKFIKELNKDNLEFASLVKNLNFEAAEELKNVIEEIKKKNLELSDLISNFESLVYNAIVNNLALKMIQHSDVGMLQFRNKYSDEFAKINVTKFNVTGISYYIGDKKVSKQEYSDRKAKFIRDRVAENAEEVAKSRLATAKKYIKQVPWDMSYVELASDAAHTGNEIINTFETLLRDLDNNINNTYREFQLRVKEMSDSVMADKTLVEKIKILAGTGSIYTKYKDDDHLITKYKKEFLYHPKDGFYAYKDKLKDLDNLIALENKKRENLRLTVLEEAVKIREIAANVLMYEEKKKALAEIWAAENTKKIFDSTTNTEIRIPADKWLDPRFTEIENDPVYKMLLHMQQEGDNLLHATPRLKTGITLFGHTFIKLPSVAKDIVQSVVNKDFGINNLQYYYKRATTANVDNPDSVTDEALLADSSMHAEVTSTVTDIEGKPIPNITFPYRGLLGSSKMPTVKDIYSGKTIINDEHRAEHIKHLTDDLFTAFLLNYKASLNFSKKSEVKNSLLLFSEVLKDSKYSKTIKRNLIDYNVSISANETTQEAINEAIQKEDFITTDNLKSNWIGFIDAIIEQRLLGIKNKGSVKINKGIGLVHTALNITLLMVNAIAAVMNASQILIGTLVRSSVGRTLSTKQVFRSLPSTVLNVFKDLPNLFTAIPVTKIGVITTALNGYKNNASFTDDLNNSIKRHLNTDLTNIFNNVVEHLGGEFLTEVYLRSVPVYDKDGNTVNNLYNVIDVKNGRLIFPKDLFIEIDREINLNTLQNVLSEENTLVNGYYDKARVIPTKRTYQGKIVFFFKSWLPMNLSNKFRGFSRMGRNYKWLEGRYDDENKLHGNSGQSFLTYNKETQELMYGYEIVFWKNMYNLAKYHLFKKGPEFLINNQSLENQRAFLTGIRYWLGMIALSTVSSLTAALLYFDLDDDEKERFKDYIYKGYLKKLKELKKADNVEDPEIQENIKDLEEIIAKGKDAIDDDYFKLHAINQGVPKYVVDIHPEKWKELNGKYVIKEPIIGIENSLKIQDWLYKAAVYTHRLENELSALSLESSLASLVNVFDDRKSPLAKVATPVTSAQKLIENPLTSVSGLFGGVMDLVYFLDDIGDNNYQDYYQTNVRSKETENAYEGFRGQQKDKNYIHDVLFKNYNRDYQELWQNMYAPAQKGMLESN